MLPATDIIVNFWNKQQSLVLLGIPLTCTLLYAYVRKPRYPLPPGPKPLPILGNALDMPPAREYITYADWGKKYGDVVHVSALGQHIIVLNSIEAGIELLDQRSAIYSDRPYLPMIEDERLMDAGFAFTAMRFSPRWKRHRRLFTRHMNPTAVNKVFSAKQVSSINLLLRLLLSDPAQLKKHLMNVSANLILGVAYGYDVEPGTDPLVPLVEKAMADLTEGFQPKFLVNLFPILRFVPAWFPGAGFKRFAQECAATGRDLVNLPFKRSVENIATGKASPSFVQTALEDLAENPDPQTEQDIKEVASIMYAAGSDTTVAVVHTLMLQLTLHPKYQRQAQVELDSITNVPGSASFRLPTFEDRTRTPFLDALIKEGLRWNPASGTGIPHAAMEEDVYRGWRIPKGSIVFGNAWGMLREGGHGAYKDPGMFKPERFLGDEKEPDPGISGAFGFGRRLCPGKLFAENTLWLEMACLLSCFSFERAKDQHGNDIDLEFATLPTPGFILHPPAFPCTIVPRSKHVENVIRETESANPY